MIYRAKLNKTSDQNNDAPQTDPIPEANDDGITSQTPAAMRPISTFNRRLYPDQVAEFEASDADEPVYESAVTGTFTEPPSAPVVLPKKKFNLKLILGLLVLFFLVLAGLFAYDRFSNYSSKVQQYDEQGNKVAVCDNILNPSCWTAAFRPQLKQENGFTTALIIGVDTRTGSSSSSLMNTDSIIAVEFNQKTQEFMLISIPRDTWSFDYNSKINAVYALTYKLGKSEQNDEYYFLKQEISKVIGKPIDYTVKVHFDGLTNLINDLGGITVCPADAFTAQYPNDNAKGSDPNQWLAFSFTKGCQQVNGQQALVYARFRHIYKGPSYLASDFSRARRQQEIINAIKSKALTDNTPIEQRAETYWSMFQTLNNSIEVNITFEDVLAGLSYINTFDKNPINVVLDPNFGGLNNFIYTDSNPSQGYTIKAKDKTFQTLDNELAKIWQFSAFYRETPTIVVRNQTGDKTLPSDNIAMRVKTETSYYNSFTVFNDAKSTKLYGVHLFDFTNGQKAKSLAYLQQFLGVTQVETLPEQYGITRSKKNEDFLIVVGPPQPTGLPEPSDTTTP